MLVATKVPMARRWAMARLTSDSRAFTNPRPPQTENQRCVRSVKQRHRPRPSSRQRFSRSQSLADGRRAQSTEQRFGRKGRRPSSVFVHRAGGSKSSNRKKKRFNSIWKSPQRYDESEPPSPSPACDRMHGRLISNLSSNNIKRTRI